MADFMAKSDLAAESKLSIRQWERFIANGDVGCVRIGRRVLVKRSDFESFMESKRIAPVQNDLRSKLEMIAKKALASRSAS